MQRPTGRLLVLDDAKTGGDTATPEIKREAAKAECIHIMSLPTEFLFGHAFHLTMT
jgi:hypothetical protein